MREMATAAGLVHFSSGDRNPRVLYEALLFGLPLFVSRVPRARAGGRAARTRAPPRRLQSMPYVGLQCQPFVFLADANATGAALTATFRAARESTAGSTRRGRPSTCSSSAASQSMRPIFGRIDGSRRGREARRRRSRRTSRKRAR